MKFYGYYLSQNGFIFLLTWLDNSFHDPLLEIWPKQVENKS